MSTIPKDDVWKMIRSIVAILSFFALTVQGQVVINAPIKGGFDPEVQSIFDALPNSLTVNEMDAIQAGWTTSALTGAEWDSLSYFVWGFLEDSVNSLTNIGSDGSLADLSPQSGVLHQPLSGWEGNGTSGFINWINFDTEFTGTTYEDSSMVGVFLETLYSPNNGGNHFFIAAAEQGTTMRNWFPRGHAVGESSEARVAHGSSTGTTTTGVDTLRNGYVYITSRAGLSMSLHEDNTLMHNFPAAAFVGFPAFTVTLLAFNNDGTPEQFSDAIIGPLFLTHWANFPKDKISVFIKTVYAELND